MGRAALMATCKACGAYMLWVKIAPQKSMPVDPDPLDDDSGVVAAKKNDAGIYVGYVISKRRPVQPGYWTYTPHHATCPKVAQFRPAKPAPPAESLF